MERRGVEGGESLTAEFIVFPAGFWVMPHGQDDT